MKKFSVIALILAVLTVLSVLPVSADYYDREDSMSYVSGETTEVHEEVTKTESEFESGDGSFENPYIIKTEEQLKRVVDGSYTACFKLGADIKIKDSDWKAEGVFSGSFDGDGHVISGLKSTHGGLFGTTRHSSIKNVGLTNVDISVEGRMIYVGAFVNSAIITEIANCYVSGSVKGEGGCSAAGFVGLGTGVVFSNCINKANVEAKNAAGFVVELEEGDIYKCVNLGSVTGESDAGAVSTIMYGSDIYDCYYLEGSVKIGESTWASVGGGITEITSDSMKKQETFEGFDFENVWKVSGSGISLSIEKSVTEKEAEKEKGKKKNDDLWLYIIIIAASVLVFVGIVVVIIVVLKKKKKKKEQAVSEPVVDSSAQNQPFARPQAQPFARPQPFAKPDEEEPEDDEDDEDDDYEDDEDDEDNEGDEGETESSVDEEIVAKPNLQPIFAPVVEPKTEPEVESVVEPEVAEEPVVESADEQVVAEEPTTETTVEPEVQSQEQPEEQPEPVTESVEEPEAQPEPVVVEEKKVVKFCTACGASVVEGANFCRSCGNKINR